MTSSACQLGELLTLETAKAVSGSVALQVLPFEAWQLVEREEFDVNHSIIGDDDCSEPTQQLHQPALTGVISNRHQTRSGSSDSGQLSLLSSFGSLSFGGYQINSNRQHSTNSPSDSTSHQSMSVDVDQHQFYCSLMLLNSLDFCQYEHKTTCNKNNSLKNNQQEEHLKQPASLSSKPSLTLSQSELSLNLASAVDHKRSLQDCRSHWFLCDKTKYKNTSLELEVDKKNREPVSTKTKTKDRVLAEGNSNSNNKKRGFGLSILSKGAWQGQGAGKIVAAAAAATNSSSFVDKLLSHMIAKRGDRPTGSMSSVKQTNKTDSKHQEMSMNKSSDKNNNNNNNNEQARCACPKISDPVASKEQLKKLKTAQSTGGIHLLSDLSRRLARRCGIKTKAVQFSGSVSDSALGGNSNGVQTTNKSASGLSSLKQNDICCESKSFEQAQQQRSGQATCGCGGGSVAANSETPTTFNEQSQQRERYEKESTTSGGTTNLKSINLSTNESQQPAKISSTSRFSGEKSQNQVQLVNQEQEAAAANNRFNLININNNGNTFTSSRNNLNASSSTLNTTQSNCCYWDNETCSSSGFVSSSTTTTGFGGRRSGGDGNGRIGSGSIGFGCVSGIGSGRGGGNCGDSTTTTHSCNSSAYNEPIVTPPSPPPPHLSNCSHCATVSSSGASTKSCDVTSLKSLDNRQVICEHYFSLGFEEQKNQDQPGQHQDQHQLGVRMAAVSPIDLTSPAVSAQLMPTVIEPAIDAKNMSGDQITTLDGVTRAKTEIQVSLADDRDRRNDDGDQRKAEVPDQVQDSKSSNNSKDGHLKPKASLLTRARNSTINLASLATVTNRFSSASVGNLWHGAGSHHHHGRGDHTAGELAVDTSDDGIQPLDYVARGPFDSYHEEDRQHLSPIASSSKKSDQASSNNRLLSVASCGSTRKVSSKEKCKRQKDAERVEKLRLLVNYLKSGSSQPVVSPVALEADEIELAEKYKMHVILRDDILQDIQASEGRQHQQQETLDRSASDTKSIVASHNAQLKPGKADACKTNNNSLINHSIGGTSTSSPASSSSSSVNHAHHSAHEGRSIPQIGDVTWVLRHSISDPGNNFEHSPAFSTASSSPSTKDHKHHHHHRNHSTKDNLRFSPKQHQQQTQEQQQNQEQAQLLDLCSSCAPSSSYSGSSLSNYCLASGSNSNKSGCVATQRQQTSSLNQQSPKMFYIDDMDMIPVFPSSCLLNAASASATTPPLAPASISQQQTSTPLTTANSTNCCSQPSTPIIYTNFTTSNINNNNTESACAESLSSSTKNSSSTHAWTNPQNLATWIDNEVNSLVHDLEAKSQQLQIKSENKHNKSGKKKWLSVTSSHSSRRSSSGAQST